MDTNISFMHYGIKRRSGRFPYGSGEFPYQHEDWFQGFGKPGSDSGRTLNQYVSDLRSSGVTDTDIANGFGLGSVNQLRKELAISKAESRSYYIHEAMRLRDSGLGNTEIAKKMSTKDDAIGESTVRAWLKAGDSMTEENQTSTLINIADMVKKNVDSKGLIDIGPGVAETIGITKDRLDKAVNILENDGYKTYNLQVNQLGTSNGMKTTVRVIAPPEMSIKDAYANIAKLHNIKDYTVDGGKTILGIPPVHSVDPSRVMVTYKDPMDGVIELRRHVEDLDLGDSQYAQVRIGVNGTHYLKGMAVYGEDKDMPEGIDIVYHSSKNPGTAMLGNEKEGIKGVLKEMKVNGITGEIDQDNPFGASIKSEEELRRVGRYYTDKDGNQQVSPINVVNEPGDWSNWSKSLPPQFLAKQNVETIKMQLTKTLDDAKQELADIEALTNPVLKQQLLSDFAENSDSAAVHMKASAFPRQQVHVLLPLVKMKEDECYAPNYENGTTVALIRYPHSGPFEIPVLTVNNHSIEGKHRIGNDAPDAIGVNPKQLGRLSGADCDGDTVTVFPVDPSMHIRTMEALKSVAEFDHKNEYAGYKGMKVLHNTGAEMGKISNLLTDMWNKFDERIYQDTQKAIASGVKNPKIGLNEEELNDLIAATRHSMVVVDAEKSKLDYRRSEKDHNIKGLIEKYRTTEEGTSGGASSLFSRAKGEVHIEGVRTRAYKDNPETGEKVFNTKEETYTNKAGKVVSKTTKSTQMYEAKDAYDLMSGNIDPKTGRRTGTVKETLYADYANARKDMANYARKEAMNIQMNKRDPQATKYYQKAVDSLTAKCMEGIKNAPKERIAQVLANQVVKNKMSQLGDMDLYSKDDIAKYRDRITSQALASSRASVGADKKKFYITDYEWEAMQADALSTSMQKNVLKYADSDRVRQLATPREYKNITDSQKSRVYALLNNGATIAEAARSVGVPASYVRQIQNE